MPRARLVSSCEPQPLTPSSNEVYADAAGTPGIQLRAAAPISTQDTAVPAGLRWCDARLFARGGGVAHALDLIALIL